MSNYGVSLWLVGCRGVGHWTIGRINYKYGDRGPAGDNSQNRLLHKDSQWTLKPVSEKSQSGLFRCNRQTKSLKGGGRPWPWPSPPQTRSNKSLSPGGDVPADSIRHAPEELNEARMEVCAMRHHPSIPLHPASRKALILALPPPPCVTPPSCARPQDLSRRSRSP